MLMESPAFAPDMDAADRRQQDRERKRKQRKANRLTPEERRAILLRSGLVSADDTAQALGVNRGKLKALAIHGLTPLTFSQQHVYAISDILPALQSFQQAEAPMREPPGQGTPPMLMEIPALAPNMDAAKREGRRPTARIPTTGIYSVKDWARHFAMTEKQFRIWIHAYRIPYYLPGREMIVRAEDLWAKVPYVTHDTE